MRCTQSQPRDCGRMKLWFIVRLGPKCPRPILVFEESLFSCCWVCFEDVLHIELVLSSSVNVYERIIGYNNIHNFLQVLLRTCRQETIRLRQAWEYMSLLLKAHLHFSNKPSYRRNIRMPYGVNLAGTMEKSYVATL